MLPIEETPEEHVVTYSSDKAYEIFRAVIVKRGDTVTELAESVYGVVNDEKLRLIKKYNPEIIDMNRIEIAQKILFPLPSFFAEKKTTFN